MIEKNYIRGSVEPESFKFYLFNNRRNCTIIWIAAVTIVLQFSVFKYLYPFASYIHDDSFTYMLAARDNLSINDYLIGYSKFLRISSVFTRSDSVLVAFQYLCIQISALFCLFTIFYFYRVSKSVQIVLICFMVFNPLFLHLANLVSSDCLFVALSLTWFSLLLWIIHRPSNNVIIWHAVVLFLAFTVRYNALIYPFIACLAFYLSPMRIGRKLLGLGAGLALCGLVIIDTSYEYKKLTGFFQYSPFSGWQLTNNAMYAYRYVNKKERKPVPKQFRMLDNMIREYFDSTRDVVRNPQETIMASTIYMWDDRFTPFQYQYRVFKGDTVSSGLKKWASMGPLYKSYGLYIIKLYPWKYIRYFVWPNCYKYFAPPLEFLEHYNSGKSRVPTMAKDWFGYNSRQIFTRTDGGPILILAIYPILSGIINVVMLLGLFAFSLLNGLSEDKLFRKGLLLGGSVWLLNAGFTIFASPAALRFQSFPILLTTIFTGLLVDWIWEKSKSKELVQANNFENVYSGI